MRYPILPFLLLIPSVAHAESAADFKRPNVLFIVCDDLNTHVATSDYPHIRTPAFSRLAGSAMTFKRAYCQYPVCGPSRASFLSGMYPQRTGVLSNETDLRTSRPGTVTLPQLFKDAGYWTAATGKIFHNQELDPGAEVWDASVRFENDEMPLEKKAREIFGKEHGPTTDRANRGAWKDFQLKFSKQTRGQSVGYGPSGLKDEQHADGKNARQAIEWLHNRQSGGQPFFIAVGIHKPHVPFLAPDAYFDLYPPENLRYPPTPPDIWKQVPRSAMVKRYQAFGFELGVENDPLRREYMQAYHACITFVDTQIGLILDAVEKAGLWDNTLIVLTSDHGFHLGEHFMWGKVTLFEVCNRVPLIVRVPGLTKDGSSSNGLVELVDLYPTLAGLCGIDVPAAVQGKSFKPMLEDPQAGGKPYVHTVVKRGKHLGKAIRSPRWRYALWPDGEELYDLENDAAEHHNLVNSASHAKTLETHRDLLREADARAAGGN
jgi:iduronate 2-sulfatase